jgi:hypothetical protein
MGGKAGRKAEADPAPLIERIRELFSYDRSWSLQAADIRELLGLSSEEFHRQIYAAESGGHPLISLSAATGTYSQENIWEFVALIELFCGPQTESRLEKAGIFFSHPEQMEILGVFLGEAAATVRAHHLDPGQFSAMLRTFGRFERARDVYIQEYFPLEPLIRRSAALYCSDRAFAIPQLAEANAKGLLEFFFLKHILEPGAVFAALIERLLRQAAAEGYARDGTEARWQQEEEGANTRGRQADIADSSLRLLRARRAMDLDGRILDLPLLKAQYKRLMKIYHPDINPRGLRRCQEITAAYSLLLSSL